jgi:ZIP family zinc transporter
MGSSIGFALLLSTMAGLSTGLGSLLAIFVKNPGPKFITLALGFSSGVMVFVSFQELLHQSTAKIGFLPANAAFLGGMVAMLLVDFMIPHEYLAEHGDDSATCRPGRLFRAGLCTAIGITIHNFPEGMASFAGALQSRTVGVAIAAAIALHNIPEGLAVSAPVYAATGDRKKALLWGLLSGAAEPAGALLAALVLAPFLNPTVLAYVLAAVAGIMVFIALDELLPAAHEYKLEHLGVVGVMAGMAAMALSLWLLHER